MMLAVGKLLRGKKAIIPFRFILGNYTIQIYVNPCKQYCYDTYCQVNPVAYSEC
jgi:hypothetical protein